MPIQPNYAHLQSPIASVFNVLEVKLKNRFFPTNNSFKSMNSVQVQCYQIWKPPCEEIIQEAVQSQYKQLLKAKK